MENLLLAKNSKKVSNILNENNYSSEDCILIIRTILNKSKRLLQIKKAMDADENIDQIITQYLGEKLSHSYGLWINDLLGQIIPFRTNYLA